MEPSTTSGEGFHDANLLFPKNVSILLALDSILILRTQDCTTIRHDLAAVLSRQTGTPRTHS